MHTSARNVGHIAAIAGAVLFGLSLHKGDVRFKGRR